jgi:hypothetical protein
MGDLVSRRKTPNQTFATKEFEEAGSNATPAYDPPELARCPLGGWGRDRSERLNSCCAGSTSKKRELGRNGVNTHPGPTPDRVECSTPLLTITGEIRRVNHASKEKSLNYLSDEGVCRQIWVLNDSRISLVAMTLRDRGGRGVDHQHSASVGGGTFLFRARSTSICQWLRSSGIPWRVRMSSMARSGSPGRRIDSTPECRGVARM